MQKSHHPRTFQTYRGVVSYRTKASGPHTPWNTARRHNIIFPRNDAMRHALQPERSIAVRRCMQRRTKPRLSASSIVRGRTFLHDVCSYLHRPTRVTIKSRPRGEVKDIFLQLLICPPQPAISLSSTRRLHKTRWRRFTSYRRVQPWPCVPARQTRPWTCARPRAASTGERLADEIGGGLRHSLRWTPNMTGCSLCWRLVLVEPVLRGRTVEGRYQINAAG